MLLWVSAIADKVSSPDLEHVYAVIKVGINNRRLAGRPVLARRHQPALRCGVFARFKLNLQLLLRAYRLGIHKADRGRNLIHYKRGRGCKVDGSPRSLSKEAVLSVRDDIQRCLPIAWPPLLRQTGTLGVSWPR